MPNEELKTYASKHDQKLFKNSVNYDGTSDGHFL